MHWIAFVHTLPSRGSSRVRVQVWRLLRRSGAVVGPGGVHLLPDRSECRALLEDLRTEVTASRGEAWILDVRRVVGWSDEDLAARASADRTREYEQLLARAMKFEAQLRNVRRASVGQRRTAAALRSSLAAIVRVDYYGAHGRMPVEECMRRIDQALEGPVTVRAPAVSALDSAAYRSRRWVTASRPGVDALACAWLIRRSIDTNARIRYGDAVVGDEVGFALPRGEFGSRGGRCAFQQIIYAFRLNTPALVRMGEIVREVDRSEGDYAQPESAGVSAALRGWRRMANLTDVEVEARARGLFDGVHATLLAEESQRAVS